MAAAFCDIAALRLHVPLRLGLARPLAQHRWVHSVQFNIYCIVPIFTCAMLVICRSSNDSSSLNTNVIKYIFIYILYICLLFVAFPVLAIWVCVNFFLVLFERAVRGLYRYLQRVRSIDSAWAIEGQHMYEYVSVHLVHSTRTLWRTRTQAAASSSGPDSGSGSVTSELLRSRAIRWLLAVYETPAVQHMGIACALVCYILSLLFFIVGERSAVAILRAHIGTWTWGMAIVSSRLVSSYFLI